MEIRDSNNSTVKKITFENSNREPSPTLKLVTSDGTKEVRQDVKPHEIRHLFIPKIYQENRSRAAFKNNRRREGLNKAITAPERVEITEPTIIYVPPEKYENLDKDIELDPEEEFQVDESNHGLYLLNYSDTENITQNNDFNNTVIDNIVSENISKIESTTQVVEVPKNIKTLKSEEKDSDEKLEANIIVNSTTLDIKNTKLIRVDNDKGNQTVFLSDEIYNHFSPLETELPVEEMAPFKFFGQKLGGQIISDNLTDSPSLSASTKSVNFIVPPSDKRKFNSRYSATEKYKNTSVDEEEEVNEDMDVSVVKNIIEKNKIRNTVKGPAPARHVGLVNAYKKFSSTTPPTTKSPSLAQLNITEPIVQNVTPSTLEKDSNRTYTTNSTVVNNSVLQQNFTPPILKDNPLSKTNTTTPRNFTRTYPNPRRRPSRVTTVSTEIIPILSTLPINVTTEKASTTFYTAVVTSVSITSSMKGQNKTDTNIKEVDNSTLPLINQLKTINTTEELINSSTLKAIPQNVTETTTTPPFSARPYRHRIRIRTTTTENPNPSPSTQPPQASELSSKNVNQSRNETELKISERLANLFRQPSTESPINGTIKPKNILKRRRPTTTTSTTTTTTTTTTTLAPLPPTITSTESHTPSTQGISTTPYKTMYTTIAPIETTPDFKPFIVTSRTSSESSSKTVLLSSNITKNTASKSVNKTHGENPEEGNEEVVIEAEKAYTASYVLAGLGFLPVAAIVVFVLRSVLNKKTKDIDTEYEGYFEDGDIKKESPITPVARPPLPIPTNKPDQKWEFPRSKLRLQTLLGQGNFGQVNYLCDSLSGLLVRCIFLY